jgi:hypothetical protein
MCSRRGVFRSAIRPGSSLSRPRRVCRRRPCAVQKLFSSTLFTACGREGRQAKQCRGESTRHASKPCDSKLNISSSTKTTNHAIQFLHHPRQIRPARQPVLSKNSFLPPSPVPAGSVEDDPALHKTLFFHPLYRLR